MEDRLPSQKTGTLPVEVLDLHHDLHEGVEVQLLLLQRRVPLHEFLRGEPLEPVLPEDVLEILEGDLPLLIPVDPIEGLLRGVGEEWGQGWIIPYGARPTRARQTSADGFGVSAPVWRILAGLAPYGKMHCVD